MDKKKLIKKSLSNLFKYQKEKILVLFNFFFLFLFLVGKFGTGVDITVHPEQWVCKWYYYAKFIETGVERQKYILSIQARSKMKNTPSEKVSGAKKKLKSLKWPGKQKVLDQ